MTDPSLAAIFISLAHQERLVLNLLLTHRRLSAPIAAAAGLDVWHFAHDDHRLIFAGWQVACEHGLEHVRTLRLIRAALRAESLWDDAVPAESSGILHSDATLARLGTRRMTEEERDYACGRGPDRPDAVERAIARHIVALVEASDTVAGVYS
jgi:hypothetical protein